MSSVRFICGTQDIHKELEAAIADYFHTEDTILYAEENGKIISVTIINSKPDDPEVLTIFKSIKVK